MPCIKCGQVLREGSKFCIKCGAPQTELQAPTKPPTETPKDTTAPNTPQKNVPLTETERVGTSTNTTPRKTTPTVGKSGEQTVKKKFQGSLTNMTGLGNSRGLLPKTNLQPNQTSTTRNPPSKSVSTVNSKNTETFKAGDEPVVVVPETPNHWEEASKNLQSMINEAMKLIGNSEEAKEKFNRAIEQVKKTFTNMLTFCNEQPKLLEPLVDSEACGTLLVNFADVFAKQLKGQNLGFLAKEVKWHSEFCHVIDAVVGDYAEERKHLAVVLVTDKEVAVFMNKSEEYVNKNVNSTGVKDIIKKARNQLMEKKTLEYQTNNQKLRQKFLEQLGSVAPHATTLLYKRLEESLDKSKVENEVKQTLLKMWQEKCETNDKRLQEFEVNAKEQIQGELQDFVGQLKDKTDSNLKVVMLENLGLKKFAMGELVTKLELEKIDTFWQIESINVVGLQSGGRRQRRFQELLPLLTESQLEKSATSRAFWLAVGNNVDPPGSEFGPYAQVAIKQLKPSQLGFLAKALSKIQITQGQSGESDDLTHAVHHFSQMVRKLHEDDPVVTQKIHHIIFNLPDGLSNYFRSENTSHEKLKDELKNLRDSLHWAISLVRTSNTLEDLGELGTKPTGKDQDYLLKLLAQKLPGQK